MDRNKTRVWHTNEKKYIEHFYIDAHGGVYQMDKNGDMRRRSSVHCEIERSTGRRDSKRTGEFPEGELLFEGDEISFTVFDYNGHDTQYTGYIVWQDARFVIFNEIDNEEYGNDGAFDLDRVFYQDDEIEKIGTKHQNPELLGGGDE